MTSGNSGFFDSSDFEQCEGDDNFYEASENLNDSVDSPMRNISEYLSSRSSQLEKSLLKPPSFSRVTGLLPNDSLQSSSDGVESGDKLDSFVKAQIIIYDRAHFCIIISISGYVYQFEILCLFMWLLTFSSMVISGGCDPRYLIFFLSQANNTSDTGICKCY